MSEPQPGNTVPGSLSQAAVTARFTFLDYLRSRRFLILLILMLIVSAILTFFFAYKRPASVFDLPSAVEPWAFYSTWWGMSATFVVVLSGIFFGGDAISSEFQNRTGYFVLPNPLRRSSVYVGKFFAALIASSIILAIFAFITVSNGLYYFGLNVPWAWGESVLFAWLYLWAVLGFTFFISSAFKSGAYSILVCAVFLLFGFTLIEGLAEGLAGIEPWFVLTYGSEIIGNVMSYTVSSSGTPISSYPVHSQTIQEMFGKHVITVTTYNVGLSEGLGILLAYFVVSAVLGLFLFERKEFT